MLLPSAFSCDMHAAHQDQRTSRPKLSSFATYETFSSLSRSTPTGLFATCRALHSILGGPVQPVQAPPTESLTIRAPRYSNPFTPKRRLQSPPRIVTPPRGANKRRREEYEDHQQTPEDSEKRSNPYQTPKRQRRAVLDLPLGLTASDFDNLKTPSLPQEAIRSSNHALSDRPEDTTQFELSHSRRRSHHKDERIQWSPDEDRQLIEAVLGKLNLSKHDWNDCAKQLGKDKDSLGRRWKLLIGKGNVGLRRGSGRMERPALDIESW